MTPDQPSPAEIMSAARALLSEECTCAVATVDADGHPAACNLYFATLPGEPLRLVVLTDPHSAHVAHWTAEPQVAVSVYAHPDRPRPKVRGLQLRAVREPAGDDGVRAYLKRFPEADSISGQDHHVFTVRWLRMLDRSRELNAELVIDD